MQVSPFKDDNVFSISEFPDMRMFMAAGLRYSLGRQTYAPSFFLNYLEDNMSQFTDSSLTIFRECLLSFLRDYEGFDDVIIKETRKASRRILSKIDRRLADDDWKN